AEIVVTTIETPTRALALTPPAPAHALTLACQTSEDGTSEGSLQLEVSNHDMIKMVHVDLCMKFQNVVLVVRTYA
ncbi:hypothetical protein CR513_01909, partial [Mucuna pruriens]